MSAPRWTVDLYRYVVRRDGKRAFYMVPVEAYEPKSARIPPAEMGDLARRIVALLNATELSSDAVAALQVAVMESATIARIHSSRPSVNSGAHVDRAVALDALTDTLNHTVRMYVELDEEPSIALDEGE